MCVCVCVCARVCERDAVVSCLRLTVASLFDVEFGHIIEVYGFSSDIKTENILFAFSKYK